MEPMRNDPRYHRGRAYGLVPGERARIRVIIRDLRKKFQVALKQAKFYPVVTVTDNGDGTAEVTFDWGESIDAEHMDPDTQDGGRLSDAIDHWKGRPEEFTIPIPMDKRIVQKKEVI